MTAHSSRASHHRSNRSNIPRLTGSTVAAHYRYGPPDSSTAPFLPPGWVTPQDLGDEPTLWSNSRSIHGRYVPPGFVHSTASSSTLNETVSHASRRSSASTLRPRQSSSPEADYSVIEIDGRTSPIFHSTRSQARTSHSRTSARRRNSRRHAGGDSQLAGSTVVPSDSISEVTSARSRRSARTSHTQQGRQHIRHAPSTASGVNGNFIESELARGHATCLQVGSCSRFRSVTCEQADDMLREISTLRSQRQSEDGERTFTTREAAMRSNRSSRHIAGSAASVSNLSPVQRSAIISPSAFRLNNQKLVLESRRGPAQCYDDHTKCTEGEECATYAGMTCAQVDSKNREQNKEAWKHWRESEARSAERFVKIEAM